MPYSDPEKRRKAQREYVRRRRAGESKVRAAKLPKAPPVVSTLADWIETLTVSQGALAGQPFKLLPWELDFLAGAFADGIDTAALTIARGNGKTALCAALAAAAVAGPLAVPRGACLVAASSYEQARILFSFALDYLRPWLEAEPDRWRVLDSSTASRVEDRKTGAVLRAIGSDPRRAHGEAPRLILADEPAQWPPNMSEAYERRSIDRTGEDSRRSHDLARDAPGHVGGMVRQAPSSRRSGRLLAGARRAP